MVDHRMKMEEVEAIRAGKASYGAGPEKHSVPALPFDINAGLLPCIDTRTLEFHYGKHHQAYCNNLNNLLESSPLKGKHLVDIIIQTEGVVEKKGLFNNAAQVYNHTLYWENMCPGGSSLDGELKLAIEKNFGSIEEFKAAFEKKAATTFGSGWTTLIEKDDGSMDIVQQSNAAVPFTQGHPLLTVDVWEHAYYLVHQNARPKYLKDFWAVVDWKKVALRFGMK